MANSGLKEVFEDIYVDNALGRILSSKAISRAIRGHILTIAVINPLMISRLYDIPIPNV